MLERGRALLIACYADLFSSGCLLLCIVCDLTNNNMFLLTELPVSGSSILIFGTILWDRNELDLIVSE